MRDDRGEKREVLNPAGFHDWPVQGDPRMEHLVHRLGLVLKGRPGLRGRLRMAALWIVPIAAGTVVIVLAGGLLVKMGAPRWLLLVIMCAVSALCGPLIMHWLKRGNADQIADLLLEEGLCPCCGYNLHGIAAASDQRIVCPECGGAWNQSRVLRTEPFAGVGATLSIKRILGSMHSGQVGWSAIDAKGRRVDLAPANLRRAMRKARQFPEWHKRLVLARRAIARGSLGSRLVGLKVVWSIALGLGVIAIYASTKPSGPPLGASILIGMPMLGVAVWATLGNFCFRPKAVRAALLAEGLCPSCAGPMDDAEMLEPGAATCRNCRSAWPIDEMKAAAGGKVPHAAEQEAVAS